MSFHGVETSLIFQRLAAEGKIQKEYIGTLTGDTNEQIMYTHLFPITTNLGVATDLETEVDVFTRPAAGGTTFTELDDDGSDFDIVGATGAVTIEEAANQAGDAGKTVSISYYTKFEAGYMQGFNAKQVRDQLEIGKMGSPLVQEIKEGKLSAVSLDVDYVYLNRATLGGVLGTSDYYKLLAALTAYIYPGGNTPGQPYFQLTGLKLGGIDLSAKLEDVLKGKMTLKGTTVAEGTL